MEPRRRLCVSPPHAPPACAQLVDRVVRGHALAHEAVEHGQLRLDDRRQRDQEGRLGRPVVPARVVVVHVAVALRGVVPTARREREEVGQLGRLEIVAVVLEREGLCLVEEVVRPADRREAREVMVEG